MSGGDAQTWLGEDTFVGDATMAEDSEPRPPETPLVAGRYRVGRLLGRGGTGQVHEALDTTLDQVVAIKFVAQRTRGARRQLRQELTALRLLALPGVVRLRDDGERGDQTYLVMDLLPGGGFDVLADEGWEAWRHQARALLEALARVHFAGVLHLDLKPGNVLLDGEGRPVITDFGLARGRAVHNPADAPREGTPRYMAPEQRRGDETTAATDLYALGGIFWEMLAGRGLPTDTEARELPVDCAPVAVRETVLCMLQEDPAARPQSTVEVLDALFDATAVLGPADLGLPEVAERQQLEALFDEDQPTFLHLARDAAAVLHRRTGGRRTEVRQQLDRWVRAGVAWWNGARVHIERPAIEQLQWAADPESRRLAHLATSDADEAVSAALEAAAALRQRGSLDTAASVLEGVCPLAVAEGRGDEVVGALVAHAMGRGDAALQTAAYLAVREGASAARVVARAMMAERRRDHEGCQKLLRELDWQTVTDAVQPAARVLRSIVLRELDDVALVAWLGERPGRVPSSLWHTSMSRRAYAQGRYADAVEHSRAAADSDDFWTRLSAWSDAAEAAIELADPGGALVFLDRLERELADQFAPAVALRCHWLRRLVSYRTGASVEPLEAYIAPAEQVNTLLAAHLAFVEATIAWRSGSSSAERLATRARGLYREAGHSLAELLADALLAAVVRAAADEAWQRAQGARPAEIAVQALALLRLAGCDEACPEELLGEARAGRPTHLESRLDVLSLAEAEDLLRGAPTR